LADATSVDLLIKCAAGLCGPSYYAGEQTGTEPQRRADQRECWGSNIVSLNPLTEKTAARWVNLLQLDAPEKCAINPQGRREGIVFCEEVIRMLIEGQWPKRMAHGTIGYFTMTS
jgi:hypothetical protein